MNRFVAYIALSILLITGILMYASAWNDAAIVDEDPHIGAGISYLTQRDMRINPEHPPLVKDLAALPLLFIPNLRVPTDHPSWTRDINGQWDFGREFLFKSGNDADTILHLARLAPIGITLLLGWFLSHWTRRRAGTLAGFLALAFFVANPVVLAHGRFVTTDVPAAAGSFIATIFFLAYLAKPSFKNLIFAGIAFGLAQLTKFSVVLLIPYFALLAISWWLLHLIIRRLAHPSGMEGTPADTGVGDRPGFREEATNGASTSLIKTIGGTVLIGVIGLGIIYFVYIFHVVNYPPERQIRDTAQILESFPNGFIAQQINSFTRIDPLRPLAGYLLGLAMVTQRATGGNTTYFMGEVSASGWLAYFPVVYLLKLPLAFHLLTLIASFIGIRAFWGALRQDRGIHQRILERMQKIALWKRDHFPELALLLFIAIYWYTSLTSNLNIGVRHLMPTVPFVAALVAIGIRRFLRVPVIAFTASTGRNIAAVVRATISVSVRNAAVAILVFWMFVASLAAWPSYLSSYNELAALRGGGENWTVDSNLDWGQDLKRLAQFAKERGIDRISIDYFGWTPPEYYIKNAEVVYWNKEMGRPSGWFAISASFKQQWCARAVPGFQGDTTSYCFLNAYEPEKIIGGSIYVYQLP